MHAVASIVIGKHVVLEQRQQIAETSYELVENRRKSQSENKGPADEPQLLLRQQ